MASPIHLTLIYGTSTFFNMSNHTGRPYALVSGLSTPISRATPCLSSSTPRFHYPAISSVASHSICLSRYHANKFASHPQLTKALPNLPLTCLWHAPTQTSTSINSPRNHYHIFYQHSPDSPQLHSLSTPYSRPDSPTQKKCHLTLSHISFTHHLKNAPKPIQTWSSMRHTFFSSSHKSSEKSSLTLPCLSTHHTLPSSTSIKPVSFLPSRILTAHRHPISASTNLSPTLRIGLPQANPRARARG